MSLRKTQNVITHITQPGTAGTGTAHNADDIAFDDTAAELDVTTVQAAVDALAAAVVALQEAVAGLEAGPDEEI